MPTNNVQTVQPITTLREVPLNGSSTSADFNDTVREILADIATLYQEVNSVLVPLVNALDVSSLGSPVVGIEGSTIYGDTSDSTALFYNSSESSPLVISDSLRLLNSLLSSQAQQVTDLSVNVSSLQARLAANNQNDISLAIQNMVNTLNTLTIQLKAAQGQINAIQTYLANAQKARIATSPGIPPGSTETVTVIWSIPFVDDPTSYIVNYAMEEDSGYLEITSFSYIPDGSGIYIRVFNTDNTATHTGFVHATGIGPAIWS